MIDILLVDDEPLIRLSMGDSLKAAGHNVVTAADGAEAVSLLDRHLYDVVVCDVRLPKVDGLSVFAHVRKTAPETDFIFITAYGSVQDAVRCLKEGATDYLTKPFEPEQLLRRLELIAKHRSLQHELASARDALAKGSGGAIVGQSPVMARMLTRLDTFAGSDAPVLILGASGTGKELVAKSLHSKSPRSRKPFVAVNCAAFPDTLLEAELFGHERGAFTGAVSRREGRFKAADGGTLFLDEIGEIPLPAQVKLLRVLQEGTIEPLGTNQALKVNVRVISATHQNLKQLIAEGRFREDLYYRLKVLDIELPPLRERRGDLPILVEYFLKKFAGEGKVPSISARAWAALSEYPFPGNIRELEHAVHHGVVLARGGEIDLPHLPTEISGTEETEEVRRDGFRSLSDAVKEFEEEYLLRALRLANGKKSQAAEMLGISRKNLWEKLRAHGVTSARAGEHTSEREAFG